MVATGSASSMLKMYKINTGMHGAQRGGGFRGSPGGGNAVPLQKLPNIDVEMRGTRSGRAAAVRLERDDVLVAPLYNSLYVLRIDRLERKLLLYPIGAPARPYEIKLFSQSDHLDAAVVVRKAFPFAQMRPRLSVARKDSQDSRVCRCRTTC